MKISTRRILIFVLSVLLLLSCVSGCGSDKKSDDKKHDKPTDPPAASLTIATVTSRELNVRSTASYSGHIKKTLSKGEKVTILEIREVDGTNWGLTEDGWICLLYVSLEEITNTEPKDEPTTPETSENTHNVNLALVIVERLNIRSGPGADQEKVGEYLWNDQVRIAEEKNGWGRTDQGWISLNYVYRADKPDMQPIQVKVLASTLNVRQGPGLNYAIIEKISEGNELTILKQMEIKGELWGYNGTGWINMTYVEEK